MVLCLIYKTLHIKGQGTLQKRRTGQARQSIGEFAVRLYLLVMSEALLKTDQHDHPNSSWMRTAMNMPNWIGKSLQSYTKSYRHLRIAGSGIRGPPQGRAHHWFSSAKQSALKTEIQVTL